MVQQDSNFNQYLHLSPEARAEKLKPTVSQAECMVLHRKINDITFEELKKLKALGERAT